MGTESNGGFRNITISNCVFESCRGLAIETVDGALAEDITFTGVTMRDLRSAPVFLRLGTRMRGPGDAKPGVLRRVILSNITCYSSARLPSILAGVPGHPVEDIKIHDVYVEQAGGGTAELAASVPEEKENGYPEPEMFGELPATGLFARHVRNLEMTNVEVATRTGDARATFWLSDVDGADFFRVRVPKGVGPTFDLRDTKNFRSFGSSQLTDIVLERVDQRKV
jgi:polygalacturonase